MAYFPPRKGVNLLLEASASARGKFKIGRLPKAAKRGKSGSPGRQPWDRFQGQHKPRSGGRASDSAALRGWDVHAHAHPAPARWAMFSRRFAAWATSDFIGRAKTGVILMGTTPPRFPRLPSELSRGVRFVAATMRTFTLIELFPPTRLNSPCWRTRQIETPISSTDRKVR